MASKNCHILLDSIYKIYRAADILVFGKEQPSLRICEDSLETLLLVNPDDTVFRIRVDLVNITHYKKAAKRERKEVIHV